MAAPPSTPSQSKSRGHTLFDRQAQLHAYDPERPSSYLSSTLSDKPEAIHKTMYPNLSTPVIHHYQQPQQQQYSPILVHRRSPISSSDIYSQTNNNVQLLGIHPRPESTYIKDSVKPSEQLLETDFPLVENVTVQEPESPLNNNTMPSDSLCCAMVEQAFDYLQTHDDDDDVVVHEKQQDDSSFNIECYYNEEHSDGNDSVDTIDLDATTSTNHQNDSKFYYSYSYYD